MTDFLLDPRDLRAPGRPDRRIAGRRREDLLVDLAVLLLPADVLELERRLQGAAELGLTDPAKVARIEGELVGLVRALERLTGEPAAEIRARATELVLEERSAGRAAVESCRAMLERGPGDGNRVAPPAR